MPDQARHHSRHRGRRGLRTRLLLALALVALAVGTLLVLAQPVDAAPSGSLGPKAARLVELLNSERRASGLRELRVLPRLVQLARAHSATMGADGAPCRTPYLHHNPNLADQVQPAGSWGENVACAGDPDQMHQALMDSPGHRRNILGDWNAVGVGAYDGRLLWGTQVFATVPAGELADAASAAQAATTTTRPPATTGPPPAAAPDPDRAPTRPPTRPAARFDPERDWPAVARELRRMCRLPVLFGA
jgi:Cysteine-rich secretory protein family